MAFQSSLICSVIGPGSPELPVWPADFYPSWGRFLDHPIPPRIVNTGGCQELVIQGDDADCGMLPIPKHFSEDGGAYVTSGIFVCKDPDTRVRNLTYARMLKIGPRRFSINLGSRGDLWEHQMRAASCGKNLEAAVIIGGPPAVYLAGSAKVAMEIDEFDIAGSFLGRPVDLVRCKTIDVEVPAHAEIVLEGEILADEFEDEGPTAEYTGYSSIRSTRNVFVVKAITRREKPLYLDIITGDSSEHLIIAAVGRQARNYTRLKEMVPGLKAINFPRSGHAYHAYFSMKTLAKGEAQRAMMLLFGLDPYLKLAIAVDEDVDVFNEADVMWALATRFQADTDMFVVPRALCSQLDPSSSGGAGAKVGFDATVPRGWTEQRAVVSAEAMAQAQAILKKHGY